MNEEELIRETRKLIGRWDNVRIVGLGWSGGTREGFQFNPTDVRTGGGGLFPPPPPPTNTGACCPEEGDCFISTQSVCEAGGGDYQGDGTTCDPDPCPPKGACCVGTDCTVETEDDCTGMGGTYQGDDTTCDPNPCETPTGACCVGTDCTIETEDDCTGMGGTYQGDDTTCDPNPCVEPECVCGFDDFESSGRRFLRYNRSITGTVDTTEDNDCDPPNNASRVLHADCSATYESHFEPIADPCTEIVDLDSSSSSYTNTFNGVLIDSCSSPDIECFCPSVFPFNQCSGFPFFAFSNCGCSAPSANTVTTATTRITTWTFSEDCTIGCTACIGCNLHCTISGSYVLTETLSEECVPV